ncbi:MAG: hypothetical protein U9Q04_07520 [Campylobacterota bacterium]|nr:hypothetical protein [Campylobacterota bacterium]
MYSINSLFEKNLLYQYGDLIYRIIDAKRAEKLHRKGLELLQRKRFEKLLYHVFENSSFYKELYRSKGITVKDIPDIKLEDLPVIDKTIMMDNFDDFVCNKDIKQKDLERFISSKDNIDQKYKDSYEVIHTSGSTGHIGLFVYDIRAWNTIKAMAMTRVSKCRLNPFKKNRLAFTGASDGHYAGISLIKDAPEFFYEVGIFSVDQKLDKLIKRLNSFDPDSLSGYSSSIHMLALKQLDSDLMIKPNRIICSADALTQSMRDDISKAFLTQPVNFYASSESLCMAVQCEKNEGLHLFEDWHCFEVLDSKDRKVDNGQSGNLTLTTLYNYTQPLIRYKLGDIVTKNEDSCSCSRATATIKEVSGRKEEFLWFMDKNGKEEFIHPLLLSEFFVPGIKKFQIEQTKKNHLLIHIIISGDKDRIIKSAVKRIDEILSIKKLNTFVTFSCEVVDEIPLDKVSGKFKLIVPFKAK